ncbi:subtilisin-like protease 4 [Zingiber officinale]|uniref:subtilisin-like protease 4 n=1 Tax=Zingiber officinale TaxID=94328 RepID=UPI001C4D282A|nr:subtilisin-like protease 4 [Zingiber officinale]
MTSIFFFFLFVSFLLSTRGAADDEELKAYIVHVEVQPDVSAYDSGDYYTFLLARTLEIQEDDAASRVIHTYRNVMTGFSAMLTERDVAAMSKVDWFVRAVPSLVYRPLTTHTPLFLGLRHRTHSVWNTTNMGEGVIIGVLDSGVTPGHPSYSDHGMSPPPAKWKGRCDFMNMSSLSAEQFCNNKLIGARSFVNYNRSQNGSTDSPIDNDGHGTHTSSTAAGAFVKRANVYGLARGLAAGVAPLAHLAIYKVCSNDKCQGHDILAGMDAAVEDGVDVLSVSLGGDPSPFYRDPVAIGGFNAMRKGVFVSCSAGNSGPSNSTLSNEAPWLLTVAASTMDREFLATVKLGDGSEFRGESIYQPQGFSLKKYPLVFPGGASTLCLNGSLDGIDVKGKIVLCDRGINGRIEKGEIVKQAGGAGMVLVNAPKDSYSTIADLHALPASHIPYAFGLKIKAYINSSSLPTATIVFKGTITHVPNSPAITSFSSRGPSQNTPGILKPDITGPGVSVLAAWNTQKFNVISGTSMSCPHLSGIAALIKKVHPDWSPAAIKSAIMTTTYIKDNTNNPISDERNLPADLFAVGAGHVMPLKVLNPGLVYDISPTDYYPYLCGLGYSVSDLRVIVHRKVNCSLIKSIPEGELNYPSITVRLPTNEARTVTFTRTVTNVGEATTTYYAKLDVPDVVSARVVPRSLTFEKVNEKKSFRISFKRNDYGASPPAVEGQLRWVSPTRSVVRSPISIILE